MNKICIFIYLIIIPFTVFSQVKTLDIIGQTPGGGGYTVNWDENGNQLIIGCGTSIWVYDMTDPHNPVKIKKRPLLGMINETELKDNILFVAATHDGIYALDYNSKDLDILAHFSMKNMTDAAAYGMHLYNDTIYVADNTGVRMFVYNNNTGFTDIGSFGATKAFGVHRKGDYIAVSCQHQPLVSQGRIQVFSTHNLSTPIAQWSSPWINVVQAVQWADLRDDIIYVCGGPETALFTKSNFFALQFDGSTLSPIDTFSVANGVPGIAQLNIINMDSRNDTLFIATTAAWDIMHLPYTYIPIVDATGLPDNKMQQIGKVCPGLWHFDVALMHGTPYAAMSSEWLGVLISDVSQMAFLDTLGFIPTGGWVKDCKVKNNKLWVCNEGYGLIVYDIDSLKHSNGFWTNASIMHIHNIHDGEHFFSSDIEFLNDTLIILNTSKVYNIKPWLNGGLPELEYEMNKPMVKMKNIYTNIGQRMVATSTNLINNWLYVFNPFDFQNNFQNFYIDTIINTYSGFTVSSDTIYYGKKYNNTWYLIAAKVENDNVVKIDSIQLTMPWGFISFSDITGISVEKGKIAVSYGKQIALFKWDNNKLIELFCDYDFNRMAVDIVLRNNYIYIADKFYGMKVYNVASQTNAVLVAQAMGTRGWMNVFGSIAIEVANDGTIYLSDFIAGVIIIDAFDPNSSNIETNNTNELNQNISIYPNPFSNTAKLVSNSLLNNASLIIYNTVGQKVKSFHNIYGNEITINSEYLNKGIYFFKLTNNESVSTGKIIVQ